MQMLMQREQKSQADIEKMFRRIMRYKTAFFKKLTPPFFLIFVAHDLSFRLRVN